MKPISEESGVRSSWLALATKSVRIRSTRRSAVRSRNRSRKNCDGSPRPAGIGRISTDQKRSVGRPAWYSAASGPLPCTLASTAPSRSGARKRSAIGSPSAIEPKAGSQAALRNRSDRPRSITMAGSRKASTALLTPASGQRAEGRPRAIARSERVRAPKSQTSSVAAPASSAAGRASA